MYGWLVPVSCSLSGMGSAGPLLLDLVVMLREEEEEEEAWRRWKEEEEEEEATTRNALEEEEEESERPTQERIERVGAMVCVCVLKLHSVYTN